MISAFEAKRASEENLSRIRAAALSKAIKDIERRVDEAIEVGKFWIKINPELSVLNEVIKHFDAYGYLIVRYTDSYCTEHIYMVWNKDAFDEFISKEELSKKPRHDLPF